MNNMFELTHDDARDEWTCEFVGKYVGLIKNLYVRQHRPDEWATSFEASFDADGDSFCCFFEAFLTEEDPNNYIEICNHAGWDIQNRESGGGIDDEFNQWMNSNVLDEFNTYTKLLCQAIYEKLGYIKEIEIKNDGDEFQHNLAVAHCTEYRASVAFEYFTNFTVKNRKIAGYVGDFSYFDNDELKHIEVKFDNKTFDSGNCTIEHKSRGKSSGIDTSGSSLWIYIIRRRDGNYHFVMFELETLRKMVADGVGFVKQVEGRDSNNLISLIRYNEFISYKCADFGMLVPEIMERIWKNAGYKASKEDFTEYKKLPTPTIDRFLKNKA